MRKRRFAGVSLAFAIAAITYPAIAETSIFIRYGQIEVERVCNYYANNRAAFDECVKLNLDSGVKVVYYDSSEKGPSYPMDWEFCPLNTLIYAPDDPASNGRGYYQPCL